MIKSLNLPFEFNTDSLDSWTTRLGKAEPTVAASQIYNILKNINSNNTILENLFLVLDSTTPLVLSLVSSLHKPVEMDKPAPAAKHKLSKLNSHLIRTLAHSYFEISIHPDFSTTFKSSEQALVIYRAIDCYGQTQKSNALNYDYPSLSLWKNLGLLYLQAEKDGFLEENIPDGVCVNKDLTTIADHIKKNLLFAIFNPYQYCQDEISTMYAFFERHANLLEISRSHYNNVHIATCFWDFHSNNPPQPSKPIRADFLLINTDKIVDHIYSSTFFSGKFCLPKTIRRRIQTRLSGYNNIFKDVTPAPPKIVTILHGFEQAVDYFEKENQRSKFFQVAPKPTQATHQKILEIEPMDQQQGKTHTALEGKWIDAVNIPGATTCSFFQTQNDDFYVVILQKIQPVLNDLAIINTGKNIICCIIRQHQNAPVLNAQQYLLQLVGGKLSLVQINVNNTNYKAGLLIENSDGSLEVLLNPEKITSGSVIQIISEKYSGNYLLTRLIELTENFTRYHIISG